MDAIHREFITNQTSFSLHLTKHVFGRADANSETANSNSVFSPLSIHILLSLVSAGSNDQRLVRVLGSRSKEELNSLCSKLATWVLSDGSSVGGPNISSANGVWIQKDASPLKRSFREIVCNLYRASIGRLDFQHKCEECRRIINSWGENETRGLIKEILPRGAITNVTRAALGNALYFKGAWLTGFNAAWTRPDDFQLLDGNYVRVPFMTENKSAHVSKHKGFKILGLPYRQGQDNRRFSMYIILPDAMDGLPALVEMVATEPLFLERHLQVRNARLGMLRIPKFKISFGFEASNALKELGLQVPFSLTEMVEGSSLIADKVFHKSFIEVDEEGTRAAAVTVAPMIVMGMAASPIPTVDFVADHPFLFLIREDVTGVVLFIGRVLDPSG